MKKTFSPTALSLLLLSFLCLGVSAQDTTDIIKIEHTFYTSYFSQSEHIPIVVQYTLKSGMVTCSAGNKVPRSIGKFTRDPLQPDITTLTKDYVRSGYDRGHNMSAADNGCDTVGMKECFYFSNMTPQPHFFNAGVWEDLENQERVEAKQFKTIVVFTGSLGKVATIGKDSVVVPMYMWKVIYIPSAMKYECYLFPDSDAAKKPYTQYVTTLEEIEGHAGIRFSKGSFVFEN